MALVFSKLNDNISDGIGSSSDKFRFGTDGSGTYGYIKEVEGADTFFPFKSAPEFITREHAVNAKATLGNSQVTTATIQSQTNVNSVTIDDIYASSSSKHTITQFTINTSVPTGYSLIGMSQGKMLVDKYAGSGSSGVQAGAICYTIREVLTTSYNITYTACRFYISNNQIIFKPIDSSGNDVTMNIISRGGHMELSIILASTTWIYVKN